MGFEFFREIATCGKGRVPFIRIGSDGTLNFSLAAIKHLPFAYKDFVSVGIDRKQRRLILKKATMDTPGARRVNSSTSRLLCIPCGCVFKHFGIDPVSERITKFHIGDDSVEFAYREKGQS